MTVSWNNPTGEPETAPIAVVSKTPFLTPVPELEWEEADTSWLSRGWVQVIGWAFATATVAFSLAVTVFSIWLIVQVLTAK